MDPFNMDIKLRTAGDSGLKEYQYRIAKPKAKNLVGKEDIDWDAIQDNFRVYFPSHATVVQSRGGVNVSLFPVLPTRYRRSWRSELNMLTGGRHHQLSTQVVEGWDFPAPHPPGLQGCAARLLNT